MTAEIEQSLNQAKAASAKRQEGYRARYLDLVKATAAGNEIDADDVAEFLDSAGIEFAQFQADVERHVNRVEWAAKAATLATQRERVYVAQQKAKQVNDAFDARVTELRIEANEKLATLGVEERAAEAAVRDATKAADSLRNSAAPELFTRIEQVNKRRTPAQEAVQNARKQIEANESRGGVAQGEMNRFRLLLDGPTATTLLGGEVESMRLKRAEAERNYAAALKARPEFAANLETCLAQLAAVEKELAAAEADLLRA